MASVPFPGVKALDAFLHQYLASTQLSHLTPYDYALQYLELPLDQPHDVEETYELFWGVCCLEDEFLAFQKTLPRVRAEPARPKEKQADIAAGSTADAFAVEEAQPELVAVPAEKIPAQPVPVAANISAERAPKVVRRKKAHRPAPPQSVPSKQDPESADEDLEAVQRIRLETLRIEAENRILQQSISRLTDRLARATLSIPRVQKEIAAEPDQTETTGLFDSISLGSTPNTSAFDSIEAKLEEYKATIRGKINDRYHSIDGIAATADAHQQKIRARLSRL